MRILRYGEHAALVELDSLAEVGAAHRALRAAAESGALPGVRELVPAARTVLVEFAPGSAGLSTLSGLLRDLRTTPELDAERGEVTLPVRYDGPDLDLVARTAELSVAEVIRLHTEGRYTVAFCGFAPGFGYLTGLAGPLRQPRLDSPRSAVPAGSIGVAGEYTAAYPRSSPGGWRLIGRTEEALFDPTAEPPALLVPGTVVRFEQVQ